MELTKTQIEKVEYYLYNKYFDAIDLKAEVLDHIISDIENRMQENWSFEDAFVMTTIRWEKHFRETSSLFLGFHYSESKILVKKAVKLFKPFYFLYLAAYFLPFIFLKLVPVIIAKGTVDFINGFLLSSSLIMLSYMFFIIVKTYLSQVKTTYRFILKTQYLGLILLIMGLAVGVFDQKGLLNPVFTGFVFGGYAVVFICHHFYKKHIEAIEKYKIS